MGSPFPGMDPYLEGYLWQEFHDRLANQISMQLMPRLRPRYVALLEKRYVLDRPALSIIDVPQEGRVVYPDVHVVEAGERRLKERSPVYEGTTITVPAVELPGLLPEEVPVLSVEIRDVAARRLVTIVEILSPVNKRGVGAQQYLERRWDILQTNTHLLEIDLLRGGQRIPFRQEVPPAHYYVYLSRAGRRPYSEIWPVTLRESLPTVPVPLLPPDEDVPLDLQQALTACYELVGYERLLDYGEAPPVLSEEDSVWAEKQVTGGV